IYYPPHTISNSQSVTFFPLSSHAGENWENDHDFYVLPIERMRRFPFRVHHEGYVNDYVVLNYRAPGNGVISTPMPTIDNRVVDDSRGFRVNNVPLAQREATIDINYRLFGHTLPTRQRDYGTIRFRVIYQPRLSHHMYRGGAPILNTTGASESMGETSWNLRDTGPVIFRPFTDTESINWSE
ncbi:MAG: hypothetical protein FWC97_10400, partial [Treponema sp.]|nr:hypothetical protein [Treponema sp.]